MRGLATLIAYLLLTPFAVGSADLEKCGEATLRVLFWNVYESALYAPDGIYTEETRPHSSSKSNTCALSSPRTLLNRPPREWRSQGLNDPRQQQWLEDLGTLWPDVQADDVIAFTIDERGVSSFFFNNQAMGNIDDPDFGRYFSAIWLSPKTTRPKLRAALIGSGPRANN